MVRPVYIPIAVVIPVVLHTVRPAVRVDIGHPAVAVGIGLRVGGRGVVVVINDAHDHALVVQDDQVGVAVSVGVEPPALTLGQALRAPEQAFIQEYPLQSIVYPQKPQVRKPSLLTNGPPGLLQFGVALGLGVVVGGHLDHMIALRGDDAPGEHEPDSLALHGLEGQGHPRLRGLPLAQRAPLAADVRLEPEVVAPRIHIE